MAQAIETGRSYFIRIEDTDPNLNWVQTQEIPVICRELQFSRHINLIFASQALRIMAGGENVEMAGMRIRRQLIFTLEHALNALEKPNPYPRADFDIEQISQYFSPRKHLQAE